MVIGPEVIWTMDCSTGTGQGFYGKESQKDHDQAGFVSWQGEGNQVEYQRWEHILPYQEVILSNYQV